MAKQRYLTNAPITEAILDLRVDPAALSRPERLTDATGLLATDYPFSNEQKRLEATFVIQEDKPRPTGTREVGRDLWLKTADEKTIAQFRTDGFTLNKLKPY